ncbi:MAG: T9SS type A sorting domain-containing protein, partial [Tannerella sp.]|nr:T9SS type A sorting domain-containing protein [Tannerella sp.]
KSVSTDDRFEIQLNYGALSDEITGVAYVPKAEAWVSGGDKSIDAYSSQPIRRLTVYSPQGIVLKDLTEINAAKYRVSSLSAGIYIVRIWTDAGQVTKKAIVK